MLLLHKPRYRPWEKLPLSFCTYLASETPLHEGIRTSFHVQNVTPFTLLRLKIKTTATRAFSPKQPYRDVVFAPIP